MRAIGSLRNPLSATSFDVDAGGKGFSAGSLGACRLVRSPVCSLPGMPTRDDIRNVASAGYRLALIGASLMRAKDPAAALTALIAAGRTATAERY